MDGPDLQASVDQALMAQGEVARMVRRYYEQLMDLGFTDDQALELCGAYQATVILGARRS